MPSPVAPANPPTYLVVNSAGTSALTVAPQQAAGPLMQVVVTGSGAGYTAGITYGVALSGGTGTGALAAVVVVGNVVTGVVITDNGTGYVVGDSLTVPGGTTAATVVVSYLPTTGVSTLELSGVNALNWGNNVWESLYRLTESFAASTAPGANVVLGGSNVTPLLGQLWFDTSSSPGSLNYYVGGGLGNHGPGNNWYTLDAGSSVTSISTTDSALNIPSSTGAVTISTNPFTSTTDGVVTASGGGTTNFLRADGTWSAPPGTNLGSVTSVAATGSTGLAISGSPITSSGTLTFTLGNELQILSGLNVSGILKRTGANGSGVYTAAGASDITSALGYTPYNASNPAGYITAGAHVTLTGSITGSGPTTNVPTAIGSHVVSNTNLALAPALTIKGNNTGGATTVQDLSSAQVTSMLSIFTASSAGLVPGSGGGTTNFLRADGTWTTGVAQGYAAEPISTMAATVGQKWAGTSPGSGSYASLTLPSGGTWEWDGLVANIDGSGALHIAGSYAIAGISAGGTTLTYIASDNGATRLFVWAKRIG